MDKSKSTTRARRFVWDIIGGQQWVKDTKTDEWLGPFESAADARKALAALQAAEQK